MNTHILPHHKCMLNLIYKEKQVIYGAELGNRMELVFPFFLSCSTPYLQFIFLK